MARKKGVPFNPFVSDEVVELGDESNWCDEQDILKDENWIANDDQLDYDQDEQPKFNSSARQIKRLLSIADKLHESDGTLTLSGEIWSFTSPDGIHTTTSVCPTSNPGVIVTIYEIGEKISFVTFAHLFTPHVIQISPPRMVVIDKVRDEESSCGGV